MNRRHFLRTVLALSATAPAHAALSQYYVSAARTQEGTYCLASFSSTGFAQMLGMLPARGHAIAVHPNRPELAVPARRPGRWLLIFDF